MSQRLPALKPREVLTLCKDSAFSYTTGSHYVLKHPGKPAGRVTVPYHNRDLKRGTLHSIIRQAGITEEGFLSLLQSICHPSSLVS